MLNSKILSTPRALDTSKTQRPTLFSVEGGKAPQKARRVFAEISNGLLDDLMSRDPMTSLNNTEARAA